MKVIIFGASGRTGQLAVAQALAAGMEVTAFVRNPQALAATANLRIVIGQVLNYEDVRQAIAGQDAVVSCLGGPGTQVSTVITEMTGTIVQAMQAVGVKRIVQMSSAGIHDELPGIVGKFVALMLKNPLRDHRGAFAILAQSGLEYTVARPLSLVDGPLTGVYREVETGVPAKARNIARADVAHFLIKAVQDETYVGESIGLAY